MMRILIPLLLLPVPAQAHIGHVGELAGHGHILAGAALGLAGLITLAAGLKGKKEKAAPRDEAEEDEESA